MTMIRCRISPSARSGVVALLAFLGLASAVGACSSSTPLNSNGGNTGLGGAGPSGSGGSTGLGGAAGAAGTPGAAGTMGTGGSGGAMTTGGTTGSGGATGGAGATGLGGTAGTAGTIGTAGTSGRVPVKHRAAANTCAMDRSASTCPAATMPDGGGAIMCARDADCIGGTNGRCDPGVRVAGCACSYDQCFADSDCTATGGPCECRPLAITSSGGQGIAAPGATPTNTCKAGNCRVDQDCGAGGYCSPTQGSCGNYGGLVGYYCHTPKDKCVDDADCASQGGGDCRYNQVGAAWECQTGQCVG